MSGLIEYAKRELELAGMYEDNHEYNKMVADAVLDLVKLFSKQGHSGFSAGMTRSMFNIVVDYKPLSPITDNPEDWMEVGDKSWQCLRQPNLFSTDDGKTHYSVDDDKRKIITSKVYNKDTIKDIKE